jgi:hypothetical protein
MDVIVIVQMCMRTCMCTGYFEGAGTSKWQDNACCIGPACQNRDPRSPLYPPKVICEPPRDKTNKNTPDSNWLMLNFRAKVLTPFEGSRERFNPVQVCVLVQGQHFIPTDSLDLFMTTLDENMKILEESGLCKTYIMHLLPDRQFGNQLWNRLRTQVSTACVCVFKDKVLCDRYNALETHTSTNTHTHTHAQVWNRGIRSVIRRLHPQWRIHDSWTMFEQTRSCGTRDSIHCSGGTWSLSNHLFHSMVAPELVCVCA